MIAKIAFLTSPAPGRYIFNYQAFGEEGLIQVEISKAHLANVVIDGASWALRENMRLESSSAVEQGAVNARVAGSSPAFPANNQYQNRVPNNPNRKAGEYERAGGA